MVFCKVHAILCIFQNNNLISHNEVCYDNNIEVSHSYLFSHENSKSHCSEKDRIGRHIVIVLASGTLKSVVNYPKVMCKLFSADSFTIDAKSLSNFHQVWGTDNNYMQIIIIMYYNCWSVIEIIVCIRSI